MARKKNPIPRGPTNQARLELPVAEFDELRDVARSLGLSVSAFIRTAVKEKIHRARKILP